VKRYPNNKGLWLWLSAVTFLLLCLAPAIPGIARSRVGEYVASVIASPIVFLSNPRVGLHALVEGTIGLGFFLAVALMLGWCLHGLILLGVNGFRARVDRVGERRQPPGAIDKESNFTEK